MKLYSSSIPLQSSAPFSASSFRFSCSPARLRAPPLRSSCRPSPSSFVLLLLSPAPPPLHSVQDPHPQHTQGSATARILKSSTHHHRPSSNSAPRHTDSPSPSPQASLHLPAPLHAHPDTATATRPFASTVSTPFSATPTSHTHFLTHFSLPPHSPFLLHWLRKTRTHRNRQLRPFSLFVCFSSSFSTDFSHTTRFSTLGKALPNTHPAHVTPSPSPASHDVQLQLGLGVLLPQHEQQRAHLHTRHEPLLPVPPAERHGRPAAAAGPASCAIAAAAQWRSGKPAAGTGIGSKETV